MNKKWTRDKIIQRAKETIDPANPPTMQDWIRRNYNVPSTETIGRYFGSWKNFVDSCGFKYLPGEKINIVLSAFLSNDSCTIEYLKKELREKWRTRKEVTNVSVATAIYVLRKMGYTIETDTVYKLIGEKSENNQKN